jgi:hypothetical protein
LGRKPLQKPLPASKILAHIPIDKLAIGQKVVSLASGFEGVITKKWQEANEWLIEIEFEQIIVEVWHEYATKMEIL